MPTTTISCGVVTAMVQNQIYALPPGAVYVFANGTAPQISNDQSNWVAVPANNIAAAAFIRSTAADTVLDLKGT